MMVYIGADHRGFELKEEIKRWLDEKNIQFTDVGAHAKDPEDDFVEYAANVARSVAQDEGARGIVICGSGVGVDIAANKIKGIRSGIGFNAEQIKSATRHDMINVLSLPSDHTSSSEAKEIVTSFLESPYEEGEKYVRRVNKIAALEEHA